MAKRNNVTCVICGESKGQYQFIKHRNEHISDKFGFCKECIKDMFDKDNDPVNIMRMLNIPFIDEIWEETVEKEIDQPLSKYLQTIATKKGYKNFIDSKYDAYANSEEITETMIARWGAGLNNDEYLELEVSLKDLERIKEPVTALEQKRYVENVRLYQRLKKEIDSGKASDIKALKTTYAQDLKELGLDIEASKDDEKTLGERISNWEKTSPTPEIGAQFDDVDKIKFYINKFFLIPFKRQMNRVTEDELKILYDDDNIDEDYFAG